MYRRVKPKIWTNPAFRRVSAEAQRLRFYLETGPHSTSFPGLVAVMKVTLAAELGVKIGTINRALEELSVTSPTGGSQKPLVAFDSDAGVVWMEHVMEDNPPSNPNVLKSWARPYEMVPDCALKSASLRCLEQHVSERGGDFVRAYHDYFLNGSPNRSRNQDQDQKQEQKSDQEAAYAPPAQAMNVTDTALELTATASNVASLLRKAVAELSPQYGHEAVPHAPDRAWDVAAKKSRDLMQAGESVECASERVARAALEQLSEGSSTNFGFALQDCVIGAAAVSFGRRGGARRANSTLGATHDDFMNAPPVHEQLRKFGAGEG